MEVRRTPVRPVPLIPRMPPIPPRTVEGPSTPSGSGRRGGVRKRQILEEDALVAAATKGGHVPEKNLGQRRGKEGKVTPNHRDEVQKRLRDKIEARDLVEEWKEGPRKRGDRSPKGEKLGRPRYWDSCRWQEGGRSVRRK
jgi:hypothetical protein